MVRESSRLNEGAIVASASEPNTYIEVASSMVASERVYVQLTAPWGLSDQQSTVLFDRFDVY